MIVYGLSDPRTNELRYVGKTDKELSVRLQQHLQPAYLRPNTHKNAWIKSLKRQNVEPEIFVIEKTRDAEAEEFWIAYYRSIGCDLTNGTVGGEGWKVGTKHSEAAKQKISEAQKGRKKAYPAWNKRRVIDDLGNHFDSLTAAAASVGCTVAWICQTIDSGKVVGGRKFYTSKEIP